MSARILKYSLDPVTGAMLSLPCGSRFLDLQVQNDAPVMWWATPSDPDTGYRAQFSVFPTGFADVPDDLTYVGSFQLGEFVGHVFCDEFEGIA